MPGSPLRFLLRYGLLAIFGTGLIVLFAPYMKLPATPPVVERLFEASPGLNAVASVLRSRLARDLPAPPPPEVAPPDAETWRVSKPESLPESAWATISRHQTPLYSKTGKFMRRVNAGLQFDVLEYRDSSKGQVAVCRMASANPGAQAFVVDVDHLRIHPGSYTSAGQEERSLRQRYATLEADLDALTRLPANEANPNNPYLHEYRAAKTAYNNYWKEVRRLEAVRNGSAGAERIEAADDLRRMMGEDMRVGKAYEAALKKVRAWNREHPATAAASPRKQRLEEERASLIAALQAIGATP